MFGLLDCRTATKLSQKKLNEQIMDFHFSKIVDKKNAVIDMFVYGILGLNDKESSDNFSGHSFAREFKWVDEMYDQINVRINSEGGDAVHGLSVVSAIMDATASVTTVNDGICASMSAVVLMTGNRVKAKDYSKLMFHSPYYIDENGDKINNLSPKQQKGLAMMRDTLIRLLMKRGKTEDEAKAIIGAADKWYTPEEALAEGLIDEIVQTGRKDLAALAPMQLVAALQKENTNSNSINSMKKVIAKLNEFGAKLADDATEDQIVAAFELFPTETEKPSVKLIDRLIIVGKNTGVITEGETGNEAKFRKLAETDMELFVDMIGLDQLGTTKTPKAPQARMSDLIAKAKQNQQPAASADEKNFAWYEKNDPKALARIEVQEPERFAQLVAKDQAQYE